MKKILFISIFCVTLNGFTTFQAFSLEKKSDLTFGITPVQQTESSPVEFGGAYALMNATVSNDYITAGGKIYWRLSSAQTASDLSQKLDIKRAFIRWRPLGNDVAEISIGKLYSYYLKGNFFQLSEIYTGNSRWGKTGIGAKMQLDGFTVGLGLPLSESYENFADSFGVNLAFAYDFSKIAEETPFDLLELSADFLYAWEKLSEAEKNTKSEQEIFEAQNDFSGTISINYVPTFENPESVVSKMNLATSYSYNADPYVASAVFKNVWNYKRSDLKKAHLASVNFRSYFGPIQLIYEMEAGLSLDSNLTVTESEEKNGMVPLYAGLQFLIPLEKSAYIDKNGKQRFFFKPQFFYYAAFDIGNSLKSAQSYEFYPRFYSEIENWRISAGVDFGYRQNSSQEWNWDWSIPLYVEYKVRSK